jgi:hypothetical protein
MLSRNRTEPCTIYSGKSETGPHTTRPLPGLCRHPAGMPSGIMRAVVICTQNGCQNSVVITLEPALYVVLNARLELPVKAELPRRIALHLGFSYSSF